MSLVSNPRLRAVHDIEGYYYYSFLVPRYIYIYIHIFTKGSGANVGSTFEEECKDGWSWIGIGLMSDNVQRIFRDEVEKEKHIKVIVQGFVGFIEALE